VRFSLNTRTEFIPEPDETKPCAQCGGMRPEMAIKHQDPYCSAKCCREAYGVDVVNSSYSDVRRAKPSTAKPTIVKEK
jgi:hypothetical protein